MEVYLLFIIISIYYGESQRYEQALFGVVVCYKDSDCVGPRSAVRYSTVHKL